MSILSQNMKLIRKRLNCTQTAFSQILEIGFRTYVRYESGERDVPAVVLGKLANLGNVSLDRLLTTRLDDKELDLPDNLLIPDSTESYTIINGSHQRGRIMLKGYRGDFLVALGQDENKLLSHFRSLTPAKKIKYLDEMEQLLESSPPNRSKFGSGKAGKQLRRKEISELKKIARSAKI